jgi:Tfp pilus assembly protein PilN
MIELNLLEKKKAVKLPSIVGIDLNLINFKMLGVALFLYYIPTYFIENYMEDMLNTEQVVIDELTTQNNKISKEIAKTSNIKNQLDAYNTQVGKLKTRSAQVDEILKIKTNPKKVLEKIARSIPDDLWFNSLKINENKEVVITGGSYTSRSIGEFINVTNDSPFFAGSISPTKQEMKQDSTEGNVDSYEEFELKGKIQNYDMRSK